MNNKCPECGWTTKGRTVNICPECNKPKCPCGATLRYEDHTIVGGPSHYWICDTCEREKIMLIAKKSLQNPEIQEMLKHIAKEIVKKHNDKKVQ